jgi:KaiC/GvpD/RAD55 family RecA-like ATPase
VRLPYGGSIVVAEFPPERDQLELIAGLLRFRQTTNSCGVVVSSNRPASNLIEKLGEYGVDLKKDLKNDRVVIIDMVSKSVGAVEVDGAVYVSSLTDLSALESAIEEALSKLRPEGAPKWLLLDSIATFLVLNSPESFLKFLQVLIGRLRVLRVDCAVFTVDVGVDVRVISTVKQMADKTVKM